MCLSSRQRKRGEIALWGTDELGKKRHRRAHMTKAKVKQDERKDTKDTSHWALACELSQLRDSENAAAQRRVQRPQAHGQRRTTLTTADSTIRLGHTWGSAGWWR